MPSKDPGWKQKCKEEMIKMKDDAIKSGKAYLQDLVESALQLAKE